MSSDRPLASSALVVRLEREPTDGGDRLDRAPRHILDRAQTATRSRSGVRSTATFCAPPRGRTAFARRPGSVACAYAESMSDTATATPVDEALEKARWDLEPLVRRRWLRRRAEAARRGRGALRRVRREATAARSPSSTRPSMAAAMRELEEIPDFAGRAGTYASLAFSVDTLSPEIGSLMQQVRERSATISDDAAVLRSRVERGPRRARRGAARLRRAGLLPPLPADVAPLPPAPAHRARGADPHRDLGHWRPAPSCDCSPSRPRG